MGWGRGNLYPKMPKPLLGAWTRYLRGQRKNLAPGSEQAGEIDRAVAPRGSQDRQPSGAQALAGTGQKHPWELAHGGRGRAGEREPIPTHARPWGQADPALRVKSAPKKSLNGKNCCLLTSYGSTRGSNICVLAVVWVPKKVLPK